MIETNIEPNFPIIGDLFWTGRDLKARKFYMCIGGRYYNQETGRITLEVIQLWKKIPGGDESIPLEVRIKGPGHDTFSITTSPLRDYRRQNNPCLTCKGRECKSEFLCPSGITDHRGQPGPRLPFPGYLCQDGVTRDTISIASVLWEPSKELVDLVRLEKPGGIIVNEEYKRRAVLEILENKRLDILVSHYGTGVTGYAGEPWNFIKGGKI
jgi:hypothetical protein